MLKILSMSRLTMSISASARERLSYHAPQRTMPAKIIRRYWTSACRACALKSKCTPETVRRISRWEHEAVLETVQARLDHHPEKMTIRRQTAEHPFGTIKCWMGATHFLTKRLPKVATEMALNVLAYNMKRVMAIIGVAGLLEATLATLSPRDAAHSNQRQQTPQGASRTLGE